MFALWSFTLMAQADDLHFKRDISVAGNSVSSSETWVNGARERTVSSSPAATIVTLRQCDLKRAIAHGMGGMIATQAGMQTVAMTAQQQAMNQLAGFNGQIKSKDDVTVEYQIFPTGQTQAKLESSLKGKAKSDGEDVLTPLIQQAANSILTEVTKK
jgi:hypothetical protein